MIVCRMTGKAIKRKGMIVLCGDCLIGFVVQVYCQDLHNPYSVQ